METPSTSGNGHALIIGTGIVGLLTAIALRREHIDVTLFGPRITDQSPRASDPRTAAISNSSMNFLNSLGLSFPSGDDWTPIERMTIVDDRHSSFLRWPDRHIRNRTLGLPNVGVNVSNAILLRQLAGIVSLDEKIRWFDTQIRSGQIEISDRHSVGIRFSDGSCVSGDWVVGADGHRSEVRRFLHIPSCSWGFYQQAMVCTLSGSRPHKNTVIEWMRDTGLTTVIPMHGQRFSLISIDDASANSPWAECTTSDFIAHCEKMTYGRYGELELIDRAPPFALKGLLAEQLATRSGSLVGESAHVLHPRGAQGLNLGISDVRAYIESVRRNPPVHGHAHEHLLDFDRRHYRYVSGMVRIMTRFAGLSWRQVRQQARRRRAPSPEATSGADPFPPRAMRRHTENGRPSV